MTNSEWITELNKDYLDKLERLKKNAECKLCGDTGWKPQVDANGYYRTNLVGVIQEKPCGCKKDKKASEDLKKQGLHNRVLVNTFNLFEAKTENLKIAKETCIRYTKDFKDNWLVLSGQSGVGKTHLAIATWNEIRKKIQNNNLVQGTKPQVIEYNDLISKLFQGMNFESDENTYQKIEKYKNVSVLLLDDLFRGNISDKAISWTFQILNHRYNKGLPTIITTNKDIRELGEIDSTIQGRMFEKTNGWQYFIPFKDDYKANYRLFGTKQDK